MANIQGRKHVAACTNLCDNVQLCSDHMFNICSDYVIGQHNWDGTPQSLHLCTLVYAEMLRENL
jgi:hypothetical protein